MRCKKAFPVDSKGNTWCSEDTISWLNFKIRHGNNRRVVQNFCGSRCSFPACVEQAVLPPEASEPSIDVSADDRVRGEEWTYARSLFDRRDTE